MFVNQLVKKGERMDVQVYHNIISNRFEVNVNSGLCELDYESEGIDTLNYKSKAKNTMSVYACMISTQPAIRT